MAKIPAESKPTAPTAEDTFVELMLVAADFVKSCGGMDQAKKALEDAGKFIERAGGVASLTRAMTVLENLKERISV